nr:MAG TPA: UBA domain protein [Caudoviricetes sp.]
MAMRSLERNGFALEKHRLALFCNGKDMYRAAKA